MALLLHHAHTPPTPPSARQRTADSRRARPPRAVVPGQGSRGAAANGPGVVAPARRHQGRGRLDRRTGAGLVDEPPSSKNDQVWCRYTEASNAFFPSRNIESARPPMTRRVWTCVAAILAFAGLPDASGLDYRLPASLARTAISIVVRSGPDPVRPAGRARLAARRCAADDPADQRRLLDRADRRRGRPGARRDIEAADRRPPAGRRS